METALYLVEQLRARVKAQKRSAKQGCQALLVDITAEAMQNDGPPFETPLLLLVVGVNGAGKTTSIGRLSHAFAQEGKKVLLAAGDTFRAAAAEQLAVGSAPAHSSCAGWRRGIPPPWYSTQSKRDVRASAMDHLRYGGGAYTTART